MITVDARPYLTPVKESCASGKYVVKWQFRASLELTLPDIENPPTLIEKQLRSLPVPLDVTCNLVPPEIFPGCRPAEQGTIMTMPETAVDEDGGSPARKKQIGLTWEFLHMEPITIAQRMKPAPDQHLRLRIRRPDTSHHSAADLQCDFVSQPRAFFRTGTAPDQSRAFV